jgi:hypothetical protein
MKPGAVQPLMGRQSTDGGRQLLCTRLAETPMALRRQSSR